MLSLRFALRLLIGFVVLSAVVFGLYQLYDLNRVRELRIAAGSPGNDTYEFAQALQETLSDVEPNLRLTLEPTEDSAENAQMLEDNEVDLAIIQLDEQVGPQTRLVALLYPEVFHLVVHRDSDIRTPADLEGKPLGTAEDKGLVETVLNYYDIQDQRVEWFEEGEDAITAFINGQVDAVFRYSEPDSSNVTRLVQEGQGRLIPFSQFEAMRLTAPYLVEFTMPEGLHLAGNTTVPPTDLLTVGTYKALMANRELEPAIVRALTSVLFDHQNALIARVPRAIYLRSPVDTKMVGASLHPGALTYYNRDQPTFFQRYATEISFALSAGPILASVLLALWARTQSQHKTQARVHIEAVHNTLLRLAENHSQQNAEEMEQRLLRILAKFTKDLKDGNINSEDAEVFSMIWDKAMAMARSKKPAVELFQR